ncbi:MAG: hypothetical protein ACK5HS_03825 [Mycoplasmatales bacterium]
MKNIYGSSIKSGLDIDFNGEEFNLTYNGKNIIKSFKVLNSDKEDNSTFLSSRPNRVKETQSLKKQLIKDFKTKGQVSVIPKENKEIKQSVFKTNDDSFLINYLGQTEEDIVTITTNIRFAKKVVQINSSEDSLDLVCDSVQINVKFSKDYNFKYNPKTNILVCSNGIKEGLKVNSKILITFTTVGQPLESKVKPNKVTVDNIEFKYRAKRVPSSDVLDVILCPAPFSGKEYKEMDNKVDLDKYLYHYPLPRAFGKRKTNKLYLFDSINNTIGYNFLFNKENISKHTKSLLYSFVKKYDFTTINVFGFSTSVYAVSELNDIMPIINSSLVIDPILDFQDIDGYDLDCLKSKINQKDLDNLDNVFKKNLLKGKIQLLVNSKARGYYFLQRYLEQNYLEYGDKLINNVTILSEENEKKNNKQKLEYVEKMGI